MTTQYPFDHLQFNPSPSAVIHIDLNSCFATVEQQANPRLRGQPVAVAAYTTPNGCIIAPSIEAKKLGITVGMRVREAKAIYAKLIVLSPDPDKYRFVNRKILALLREYSCNLSVKSIDEIVLNFSGGRFFPDRMKEAAREIKNRIRQEIGEWLTVSVGISTNRYLAKVASGLEKPDGLTVINHSNFQEIYQKMKVESLCGIKFRNMLRLHRVDIFTVWNMYRADIIRLKAAFMSITAYYWYLRLRGFEIDEVEFARKSFGHSYAIYKATSNPVMLTSLLCKLVEKMGKRLRNAGYNAQGIHMSLEYSDYSFWHHGHTTAVKMYASNELYRQARKLMFSAPLKPVRVIAVSCFKLTKNTLNQLCLLPEEEEKRALISAIDAVNNRYGIFTVFPATMMGSKDYIPDRIAFGGIRELEEFVFREQVSVNNLN